MEKEFIATFYAHFGAVRFVRELEKCGVKGKMKPVPRTLSSSCGTCVSYNAEKFDIVSPNDEIEQIVQVTENGYGKLYDAETDA